LKAAATLQGANRHLRIPALAAGEWAAALGTAGAIAIAYFLAARLGLAFLTRPEDVAVFWPASGIAVGIFIALGRRVRVPLVIGVVAATIAANLMGDRSLWTSLLKGFCNAGEAVFTTWLIERWFGRAFTFDDLRHVLGFVVAVCVGVAAFAVPGAATMTLFHTTAPYWDVWRTWFLADAVGIVMVAPLLIELDQVWRKLPSRAESIEGGGVLILLTLISLQAMTHPTGSWLSFDPDAVVLPLLLWLIARCHPIFGIAGAFVESATVIYATTFGIGHFGDAGVPIMHRVSGAQIVITMVTLYTLVLAALFAQRRANEAQLAKKSAALARLHETSSRLWLRRDLLQALDEILAGAIELMVADMGTIRILDTTRGVLKIEAQRGLNDEYLRCFGEITTDGGSPCCRASRSAERIVVEDVETDKYFAPFRPIARAAGYRAAQSTPITSREGVLLGTLATHFRSVHRPAEQDLRLLDLYVRQAADIIERHKAEDALRESEERLRLAQLRTGVGIWDWNLRTGRITCTPELEAIFGLEPGAVKSYADFRDRVHPEDIGAMEAKRQAALRNRETIRNEFRIIRLDGQIRWLLSLGGAFYDEETGEPIRILGNNTDITARKEAEEKLRKSEQALRDLLGALPAAIFVTDADSRVTYCNQAAVELWGKSPELGEDRWYDLARPYCADGKPSNLRDCPTEIALRKGKSVRGCEAMLERADGTRISVLPYPTPIRDATGAIVGVINMTVDITERKELENHKNTLISELDHRVKNVLAIVSTVASRTQETSSSMSEFVSALDGRIKSMATTHELLSHRRWRGIPLAELVRGVLAPYVTANNARVDGPDVVLRAEAGQTLAMVLHELATNAAKFGALSAATGRVSVRWSFRRNGHAEASLCIQWEESGGPRVVPQTRSGFGTSVMRELIPYELGGTVDLMHLPEGVHCKLEIPPDWFSPSTSSNA
jgi:PAS domain S-box-containing protein